MTLQPAAQVHHPVGHLVGRDRLELLGLGQQHDRDPGLLAQAGMGDADPGEFRRYGSARRLYTFDIDHAGEY